MVAENLIHTVEKWGIKLDIALTGGEPLLKEEIFELLSFLENSRFVGNLSLITNGTILSEYIKELKKFRKLKEIKISLEGVEEETNDSIRGKGTFLRVTENVKEVLSSKIPLLLMFTVMKKNFLEVSRLPDFCIKKGFKGFIIERFFPLGQGGKMLKEVLSGEEFLWVWKAILDNFGFFAKEEELIKYRAIRVLYNKGKVIISGAGCIVGRDGMAILPDGTVLPCRRFPLPIGNLVSHSFSEIWNHSDVLNSLRNKKNLKGICKDCMVNECMGCRAMSYCLTGDYLQEDPHCWIGKPSLLI